jgi:hypothetical protein
MDSSTDRRVSRLTRGVAAVGVIATGGLAGLAYAQDRGNDPTLDSVSLQNSADTAGNVRNGFFGDSGFPSMGSSSSAGHTRSSGS